MSDILKAPISIIEAYVFANTPSYLFSKMYADDFVNELTKLNMADLQAILKNADAKNIESVATSYAALIALLKCGLPAEEAREASRNVNIDWPEQIISIYKQKIPQTQIQTLSPPKHEPASLYTTNSETNSKSFLR